ncbi:hypothetical protein SODALDRAFT_324500 [Sodiomyces alkalinus F11]|uniref:Uncharacterized protein n=1 Tax=Sodiomyces alkalinus (strain CBS 110278 / VKM F-3762 / F11) TaxID=1314773 RepID=A0A3N2PU81_SODAK|nr:hypothetical protein SODALDRAFT_324500 [Sodiomyces alkalinus F11]ROT38059.1 hypothetical protein SODALDRAFT_324500 [Sodiomyces alkalinus F11]
MKVTQLLALMGAVTVSLAQSLPPAPTASVGCEPHGDHWHCEGPAESGAAAEPSHTHSHSDDDDHEHEHEDDDDHDHESTHPDLPPSPTASVGCEPHGDHWDCEGPVETDSLASASASATGIADDHEHDHDDGHEDDDHESTPHPDLPPSPTASVGCEPHGDHWHCEGPVASATDEGPVASATDDEAAAASSSVVDDDFSGASQVVAGAGVAVLAALLAL